MVLAVEVYLVALVVMSLICFATYGFDKRRAVRGGRRVPEKTLHVMAFFGGWPGAIYAQRVFRHKTQKTSFRVVFWILVVLHVAIVISVTYNAFTRPKIAMNDLNPVVKEPTGIEPVITPRSRKVRD